MSYPYESPPAPKVGRVSERANERERERKRERERRRKKIINTYNTQFNVILSAVL